MPLDRKSLANRNVWIDFDAQSVKQTKKNPAIALGSRGTTSADVTFSPELVDLPQRQGKPGKGSQNNVSAYTPKDNVGVKGCRVFGTHKGAISYLPKDNEGFKVFQISDL